MAYLNLAAVRVCTESEGPGKRFAIWSQGCLRRCPGCCNPHMQPIERRSVTAVEDLFALIKKHKLESGIEGVSFIGGEPLLQAAGFAELAQKCQEEGLSVLLFTGYLYEDILAMNEPCVEKLIRNTDILVDGEFVADLYDDARDWVGSSNQRVIFLSDRYHSGVEYENGAHSTEIIIGTKSLKINGWPVELKFLPQI